VLHPVFAPLRGVVGATGGSITFVRSCLTRQPVDVADEARSFVKPGCSSLKLASMREAQGSR